MTTMETKYLYYNVKSIMYSQGFWQASIHLYTYFGNMQKVAAALLNIRVATILYMDYTPKKKTTTPLLPCLLDTVGVFIIAIINYKPTRYNQSFITRQKYVVYKLIT
jgi:hypothetical protein